MKKDEAERQGSKSAAVLSRIAGKTNLILQPEGGTWRELQ